MNLFIIVIGLITLQEGSDNKLDIGLMKATI